MLTFFSRLNISKKLNFMALSTAMIIGMITIIFIVLYQYIDGRKDIEYANKTLSKILAQNITPALLFKDTANIQESLSSLKFDKNIIEVYALGKNGKILGTYIKNKPSKENEVIKKLSLKEKQFWQGLYLYTLNPVIVEKKKVGCIVLVYTIHSFMSHLLAQTSFIALIIILAILLTFKYYKILSFQILKPISQLNKSTTNIIKTKALNTQVQIYNKDEIGELAKNFNIMLCELLTYHEALSKKKDLLDYKANHDELTGLPNRALFSDRLDMAIKKADRYNTSLAVFFLDIDLFKQINDQYGHDVGDEVLKRFAKRLRECLRAEDTLARMGGDEFMIVLKENDKLTTSTIVANKIIEIMKNPIRLGESNLDVTTSIGISIYPKNAKEPRELIKNADLAMYKAKELGGNNFQFFT